jgi:Flp pilus assembly protein CpaB
MKNRTNLLIIIGGALAVFALVLGSLRAATSTAVTVLAARPIAAGTRLTAADVSEQPINTNARVTGALDKAEEAIGQVILIARAPGDQIAASLVSDQAGVGLPAHLEPGTVAIGVHVNQASGLGGALREGDLVTVIAVIDPQNLGGAFTSASTMLAGSPDVAGKPSLSITPTPTPRPQTAAARVTVSGLKVLLVPQAFRYEEVPQDQTGQLSPVRASASAQQNSIVLLQAPLAPVEVAPGVRLSPAELLALLDEKATLHLALEPRDGLTDQVKNTIGVQLADVYALLIGNVPPDQSLTLSPVLSGTMIISPTLAPVTK